MSETINFKLGTKVEVIGKNVIGTVAFIGLTEFAQGKWIGVTLDESKGKNNGTVQGKSYFNCPDNHGIFVRQTQLQIIETGVPKKGSPGAGGDSLQIETSSGPSSLSPGGTPKSGGGDEKPKSRSRVRYTLISKSKPTTMSQIQRRNQLTRLPVSGRDVRETQQKSLQSTPSGSRNNLTSKQTEKSKRSSFVETGFVAETIIPTYTPGSPGSHLATPASTPIPHTSEERFNAIQNIENLKNQLKDANEKIETLKAKRAADQDKLRENDRMRLQVEALTEFKTKVLESQASLQRDLKKAQSEAREAIEARERHADEMSDLSEAVEMATLDKEMAEEKAETLQLELEEIKDNFELVSTELNTLKEQCSTPIRLDTQSDITVIQFKQLQAENGRMREAIVKLRDNSAHEKHQHQKTLKDVESLKTEVIELRRTKERVEGRCQELETQVSDLQEQNDAALGAAEMVENLAEKNLNLEEKVGQLNEAVNDLEALQDVNEQLQESAKELEMELREELQQEVIVKQNVIKERDTLVETVTDQNATILRFRELVSKLREENQDFQKKLEYMKLEEETSKSVPNEILEAQDYVKKVLTETKERTTAIDLEWSKLKEKEASIQITMKAELDKTRNLMIQLEDRDSTIKEIRRVLRSKQEEHSEASIRKEMAEKKLSDLKKVSEMKIENLERKFEDVQLKLQNKEREFKATFEHFQADIEKLESERGELKEKLILASKRAIFEGITNSQTSTPIHSPIVQQQQSNQFSPATMLGSSGPLSLIEYTRYLQRQNWRLRSVQVMDNLKSLPPLHEMKVPKKKDKEVEDLENKLSELKLEWTTLICESMKIAFDSKLNLARKKYLIEVNEERKRSVAEKMSELKHSINSLLAQRKSKAVIKADFIAFPNKININESDDKLIKVGMIKFPGWEKEGSNKKVERVVLSKTQLQELHRILEPFR